MSGIHSNTARIETAKPNGEPSAFMDISFAVSDFAAMVRFHPELSGHFVLATRQGDTQSLYLIAVPSERWLGDVKDEGFTVTQTLSIE